jgi:hypothetical protein
LLPPAPPVPAKSGHFDRQSRVKVAPYSSSLMRAKSYRG